MLKFEFSSQRLCAFYTASVICDLFGRNPGNFGWLADTINLPGFAQRAVADFNWWSHAVAETERDPGAWGHATLQQMQANGIMNTINRWGVR